MGRTAGRDAESTKRAILHAATRLIARRGSDVSISEIARAAGVSKGGLLYHFPTKEALLRSGAEDLFERFRLDVFARAAAEPDGTPGRLARGYIQASFADASEEGVRELIAVAAQLAFEPVVRELSSADGRRWRDDLMSDGLSADAVRMIVAATDGVSSAPLWGEVLDAEDRQSLLVQLMKMTRAENPENVEVAVMPSVDERHRSNQ